MPRESILVVDDEPGIRYHVTGILRRASYDVSEARDGADAIRLVAAAGEPVDLLVTDLVMPNMAGPELFHHLRRCNPGLKLLVMSGYGPDATTTCDSLLFGAAVLGKPFDRDALLAAVRGKLNAA